MQIEPRVVRERLARKPKGKFGAHKYAPEDWGLDAAKIRSDMAPYMAHYEVVRED